MRKFLSILESGNFETSLPKLSLIDIDGNKQDGSGRLSWSVDNGLMLRGLTALDENTFFDFFSTTPGSFLGPKDFLRIEATTEEGEELSSHDRIPKIGYSGNYITKIATWDVPLHHVTIREADESNYPKSVQAVFQTADRVRHNKLSSMEDDNPIFGSKRMTRDWSSLDTEFGRLDIRKTDNASLLVSLRRDYNVEEFERCLESARLAVSFLEGRSTPMLGYEAALGGSFARKLYSKHRTTERDLPSPAHSMTPDEHTSFLAQAASFFHTELGRKFSDYLRMCWDTLDNYGSVKASVACFSVEAMVGLLRKLGPETKQVTKEEIHAQTELLAELRGRQDRLGERFVNRIDGIVKGSNKPEKNPQPMPILRRWQKHGVMEISSQEVTAWSELRNRIAHGTLAFTGETDQLQNRLSMLLKVHNLVNKLILQAMEYRGSYFDYSLSKAKRFPLANANEL